MRIGMILGIRFPPDIRVEKEAKALLNSGYKIHLLASSRKDSSEPLEEYVGRVLVRRVPLIPKGFHFAYLEHIMSSLRFYSTFHNPYWAKHIEHYCRDFKIDALHVHDLPLIATAFSVARRLDIPVVADLHENYPEGLRIWANGRKVSWSEQVKCNPSRWAKYERKILQKVDQIIVVVDEAKERLLSQGLPPEKIKVIYNAEDPEFWEKCEIDERIVRKYRDAFVVSYIGGFGPHRGIDCAIKAMSLVSRKAPEIKLLLVGKGGWYGEVVDRMISEAGMSEIVEVIPRVPLEQIRSYMEATDVGLVPYNSNLQTEASAPHKLFQYMIFGKPVIVSSCRSLERIIEEMKGGLVFKAGDPESLAEKILALHSSDSLCRNLGEKMKQAGINSKYSWNNQSSLIINLYNDLFDGVS